MGFIPTSMATYNPNDLSTRELHPLLLGAVGPRPIAFASTIDAAGNVNLSPYSFFNVFSANPPVVIFSPARRVRDNTTKHTLQNCHETRECVINIVNHAIVHQMSLSSTEYAEGVNEFVKAGLTEAPSQIVQPPRVAESPVQLECKVKEIVELGNEGGAGNLIICEVVMIHVHDEVLDEAGKIDQHKIDQVARMGGNWYSRARDGMFEIPKPLAVQAIGFDALPDDISNSSVLTGNDLAQLAGVSAIPVNNQEEQNVPENVKTLNLHDRHTAAKRQIEQGNVEGAWHILQTR